MENPDYLYYPKTTFTLQVTIHTLCEPVIHHCSEGNISMKRLLILLAAICVGAYAQSDTASLSGAITDPGSAAIPGAKVTLRNVATRSQRTALTDIQGLYRFSLLLPGDYEITIDSTGIQQFHHQKLTLNVAQAARLDVQMEVGSNTEIVEVHTSQL